MDKTPGRHATDPPDTVMLELVRQLATELRRQSGVATVRLDSLLERELGFDSLARIELLARIEQACRNRHWWQRKPRAICCAPCREAQRSRLQ